MADGINLRLRRRDMNIFRAIDQDGRRPVVHVAGRHPVALCPSCRRPSVTTNGTGWRDVIDVVRTVVVTLSICVRRFVCEFEDCSQRTFDERFEGIGRGAASDRALAFFADLQRGRATRRVAIDRRRRRRRQPQPPLGAPPEDGPTVPGLQRLLVTPRGVIARRQATPPSPVARRTSCSSPKRSRPGSHGTKSIEKAVFTGILLTRPGSRAERRVGISSQRHAT